MPAEQAVNPLFATPLPAYILIFLVFYFLLIRPQQKKQKEHKEQVSKIKKNDQIVTAGGIHGTVSLVKDATVVVRVDDKVKIEFDKESISTVVPKK